jgi:hypothetical protein
VRGKVVEVVVEVEEVVVELEGSSAIAASAQTRLKSVMLAGKLVGEETPPVEYSA